MPFGNRQRMQGGNGFWEFRKVLVGVLMGAGIATGIPSLAGPATPSEPNGTGQPVLGASCPGNCTPRVSTFGHYQTQWRSWAGERRPDRFFPQSIGLEAIPSPEPGPMPVLPRQKISTEKPSLPPLPKLPTELPLTPPEEKPGTSPGPSKPPGGASEQRFRIEDRSPLEGIPATPVEPMRPGLEKPGVQMPLPLEPSPKPATQMPLPLEAAPKPASQAPLPLEPLPPEKPSASVPGPGLPGPTGGMPGLPSVPEQPEKPPTLPIQPTLPAEKPSNSKPSVEPGPEKATPAPKTSQSVPGRPADAVLPAAPDVERTEASSSLSSGRTGANRLLSSPPGPTMGSESGASPLVENQPGWDSPARAPGRPIASELPPSSSQAPSVPEPTASPSAGLADPLEPWAEPRAWHPSASGVPLGSQLPEGPSARPGPETPSRGLPPEAPLIDSGLPSDNRHEAGPTQAAFQNDLPPADRASSGLSAGNLSGVGLPSNYQLEGYCPVSLLEKEQWIPGNPQFAVQHQGKVYLLAGPSQQQRFLANPDRYVPVGGGMDPVLAVEEHRHVPGRTEYCVVYDGRLYLFSSPESLARFHQNPKKYASFVRLGL